MCDFDTYYNFACEVSNLDCKDIISKFASLNTDYDRVKCIYGSTLHNYLEKNISINKISLKCSKISNNLRNQGNELFRKEDFLKSIRKYTNSLSFCPATCNEQLSILHANRSAVLYHLNNYSEALQEIQRAITNNYPSKQIYKLFLRKGKCLAAIKSFEKSQESYKMALQLLNETDLPDKTKKIIANNIESEANFKPTDNNLFSNILNSKKNTEIKNVEIHIKLQKNVNSSDFKRHPTYVNLSNSCNIAENYEKGRYIIAKTRIPPGEIVLIEQPFAHILIQENKLTHCHHCLVYSLNLIPCKFCTKALFCSDLCYQEATASYHQYECSVSDLLISSGLDKLAILTLRAITKQPLNELIKEAIKFKSISYSKTTNIKQYLSEDYNNIINLVTNSELRNFKDLFKRTMIALYLLKLLKVANYFTSLSINNESSNKHVIDDENNINLTHDKLADGNNLTDENNLKTLNTLNPELIVLELLLKHLQAFPCNAHEISEFQLNPEDVVQSSPNELGAAIYTTLSLFNHSCNPNVVRHFYQNICVVRTISSVDIGQELVDNYGTVYALQSKIQRNKNLSPQYFFECNCEACFRNWPLLTELLGKPPVWLCSFCRNELITDFEGVQLFDCLICQKQNDLKMRKKKFLNVAKEFNVAFEDLINLKVENSLPAICKYIAVLNSEIAKPWNEFNRAEEALKHCFSILGNCRLVES